MVSKGSGSLMLAAAHYLVPHGAAAAWPPRPPAPPRDARCGPRMGLKPWDPFLGPFCSLYGIAQHEMLPGSRHCLETPLACNTISGRGVYNFICNRSGWSKTF